MSYSPPPGWSYARRGARSPTSHIRWMRPGWWRLASGSDREERLVGTDIYGWIEVYTPEIYVGRPRRWTAAVQIDEIVSRNYGMFGSLFGARNDYGFLPIAPSRGIPADVSDELKQYGDVPPDPGSWPPSWITWREISEINWDEFGDSPVPGRDAPNLHDGEMCSRQAGRRRWISWRYWRGNSAQTMFVWSCGSIDSRLTPTISAS